MGAKLLQVESESRHEAGTLAHELMRKGFAVVWEDTLVLTTATREQIPAWQKHGRVFSDIETEGMNMELVKTKPEPGALLRDLEDGQPFRYPKGTTVYMAVRPTGNLENAYRMGRVSGKTKVWIVGLEKGYVTAEDDDKRVIPCRFGKVEWHEA